MGGMARGAGLGSPQPLPSQLLQAGVSDSSEASPSVHSHLFAIGGWVWERGSVGHCCRLPPDPDGPRLRTISKSNWDLPGLRIQPTLTLWRAQPPTTPKETHGWCPHNRPPTPNGFLREAPLWLAIYIYNLFTFTSAKIPTCPGSRAVYIRPSVSARVHLRQSQDTSITRQAPHGGTGQPRGPACHSTHTCHCPAWDSHCIFTRPAGQGTSRPGGSGKGSGRSRQVSPVGWEGEGQHVRGRCVPTPRA